MNRITIRSMVVRAVAAGALVAGLSGVVLASQASALTPTTYFAATNGSPANTPCTNKNNPCDLQTALTTEAANADASPGSEVELLNGTYGLGSGFANIGTNVPSGTGTGKLVAGNNNMILAGQKAKKVTLNSSTAPAGTGGQNAIIDLTGTTGITVENMTVEGGGGFTNNGPGNDSQAILVDEAGGTATVSGVTVENDSPANVGINTLAGTSTLRSDTLTSGSSCSTVTKTSAGDGSPFINVKNFGKKKCGGTSGAQISINGTNYGPWSKTGKHTLELTGSGPAGTVAAGEPVVFSSASGAYTTVGIDCDGSGSNCTVNGGSVAGTTVAVSAGNGPVGIAVSDEATLTVSGGAKSTGNVNSDFNNPSDPNAGPGAGIAAGCDPSTGESPAAVNLSGGSTSGDDVGVLEESALAVGEAAGGPCMTSPAGATAFNITGGTYGGGSVGVLLEANLPAPYAGGDGTTAVTDTITGASISGTGTGAGLELGGTSYQTLGAAGAANTFTVSNNGVGIAFGDQASANTITNANVNSNIAFGVEDSGTDTPQEFSPSTNGAGNSVTNSTFASNGATASEINGANIVDFTGYGASGGAGSIGAATCVLSTTSAIAEGSGAPSSLNLKNTGSTNCTVDNGQALAIPGLAVTLYVDNGVGISHVVAPGSSFNFTVAPVQAISLSADPAANIPTNTPVTPEPPSVTGTHGGIAAVSGNSTDITGDSCSALNNTNNTLFNNVTNPGLAATGNGGYFDC